MNQNQKWQIQRHCLLAILSLYVADSNIKGVGFEKHLVNTGETEVNVILTNEPEHMHTAWPIGTFATEPLADEFISEGQSYADELMKKLQAVMA